MGGWVKLALGVLVATLVAVLIISATGGDDSSSPSTATVADGQSDDSADKKADAKKGADGNSKGDGGQNAGGTAGGAPAEGEFGFAGSGGGSEEQSGSSNESSDSGDKGSNGTKAGGLGDAASKGSKKSGKKQKKKKKKPSQAPPGDPERDAASAVLAAYMSARAAADWPTACANLSPPALKPLEKVTGAGRGCVATFSLIYPRLAAGAWANTMTGPIVSLRVEGANGIAFFHGTTGRDYTMAMRKEGGTWKVAAIGPIAA